MRLRALDPFVPTASQKDSDQEMVNRDVEMSCGREVNEPWLHSVKWSRRRDNKSILRWKKHDKSTGVEQ